MIGTFFCIQKCSLKNREFFLTPLDKWIIKIVKFSIILVAMTGWKKNTKMPLIPGLGRQTYRQTSRQTDRHAERLTEWFLVLHFAAKKVWNLTALRSSESVELFLFVNVLNFEPRHKWTSSIISLYSIMMLKLHLFFV